MHRLQSKALPLILAAAFGAFAQQQTPTAPAPAPTEAAARAPVKLATIHVQNAILSTKEGQKAAQDLQSRYNPRRTELEKKQAGLQALQQQMRTGGATMSAAAKEKLTRQIDDTSKSLQRESEDFDAEVQEQEGKIMNDLGQKIMGIIGKYTTQHAIAMLVDVSNPQGPVLWADPSLDITTEIIKQYDEAYPVSAAPAGKKQ